MSEEKKSISIEEGLKRLMKEDWEKDFKLSPEARKYFKEMQFAEEMSAEFGGDIIIGL